MQHAKDDRINVIAVYAGFDDNGKFPKRITPIKFKLHNGVVLKIKRVCKSYTDKVGQLYTFILCLSLLMAGTLISYMTRSQCTGRNINKAGVKSLDGTIGVLTQCFKKTDRYICTNRMTSSCTLLSRMDPWGRITTEKIPLFYALFGATSHLSFYG